MTTWVEAALAARQHSLAVRDRLAEVRGKASPRMAAQRFEHQPGRVDRVYRAVLAVLADQADDAPEAMRQVDRAVEWTQRQWPPEQSKPLDTAWAEAKKASDGESAGRVPLEVFAQWLLEVRQRCRALGARGDAS